jgi:ketosteroid isomerase-like protein
MSKATVYVDRVVYYGGLQWQSNRGGSIMETHEPVNNHSDVAASADRDNLAKEGIRKFNETVTAAFRNQDAAAMASLWTENARVLPPGQEMITGRAAVQAFWQSGFGQGAYDLVLESPEIKSLGDGVSYEIGRNIVRVRTADGSSIDVPGKSLCMHKLHRDFLFFLPRRRYGLLVLRLRSNVRPERRNVPVAS